MGKDKFIAKKKAKKKVCMFCKELIDDKNEKYYWVEYYEGKDYLMGQFAHTSCRDKFFERRVLQKIENKFKEIAPNFPQIKEIGTQVLIGNPQ